MAQFLNQKIKLIGDGSRSSPVPIFLEILILELYSALSIVKEYVREIEPKQQWLPPYVDFSGERPCPLTHSSKL